MMSWTDDGQVYRSLNVIRIVCVCFLFRCNQWFPSLLSGEKRRPSCCRRCRCCCCCFCSWYAIATTETLTRGCSEKSILSLWQCNIRDRLSRNKAGCYLPSFQEACHLLMSALFSIKTLFTRRRMLLVFALQMSVLLSKLLSLIITYYLYLSGLSTTSMI